MPGALEGIKVVELASFLAAPCATVLLADWGADVVKIEPLYGDPMRHQRYIQNVALPRRYPPHIETPNRNKRSLAIDLKQPTAKDVFARLVSRADVFVTNQLTPVLEKLGAAYEQLREINPTLVYARVTGYGSRGADKDKQAYDRAAYWARSGLMHRFSTHMPYPPDPTTGMGDITTSMMAAGAITAALFARERTGAGQEVDVSLYQTGVWVLQQDYQIQLNLDQEVVQRPRTQVPNPLWGYYRTKDGRWISLVMIASDRFWPTVCRALGLEELRDDPRFCTLEGRNENSRALVSIMDAVFATKTTAEWVEIMRGHGMFFEVAQTLAEVLQDPQARENGFFPKVAHPELGEITTVASPAHFHRTPATVRSAAPEIGEDNEEVLLELGYSAEDIGAMRDQGVIV